MCKSKSEGGRRCEGYLNGQAIQRAGKFKASPEGLSAQGLLTSKRLVLNAETRLNPREEVQFQRMLANLEALQVEEASEELKETVAKQLLREEVNQSFLNSLLKQEMRTLRYLEQILRTFRPAHWENYVLILATLYEVITLKSDIRRGQQSMR